MNYLMKEYKNSIHVHVVAFVFHGITDAPAHHSRNKFSNFFICLLFFIPILSGFDVKRFVRGKS